MKIINQYLDSLETYLPEKMREEVREELEASIYGEIEDLEISLGRAINNNEQENLVKKLGHPMQVASSFQTNQEVIGTPFFPAYKVALKISIAITAGILLLMNLPIMFAQGHGLSRLLGLFWQLIDNGLSVFAIVTIIFYLMQKNSLDINKLYAWSINDLRQSKIKLSLSRVEVFFELIIELAFLAWWNDLFDSSIVAEPHQLMNHVLLSPEWGSIFNLVNWLVSLSIILSLYKLFIAGWDKVSLAANTLINLAVLAVIYYISGFEQLLSIETPPDINNNWLKASHYFELMAQSILGFIAVISCWEVYSNSRKLLTYKF